MVFCYFFFLSVMLFLEGFLSRTRREWDSGVICYFNRIAAKCFRDVLAIVLFLTGKHFPFLIICALNKKLFRSPLGDIR